MTIPSWLRRTAAGSKLRPADDVSCRMMRRAASKKSRLPVLRPLSTTISAAVLGPGMRDGPAVKWGFLTGPYPDSAGQGRSGTA
jgi:hypothetical protein